MRISIGTHVNGCAGRASVHVSTCDCCHPRSAELHVVWDYTTCAPQLPGRDLLLCSVFDCCKNKLSAFPSTIISSEVIWLL